MISLWHGLAELLRSPSGVFATVTLACITLVSWHAPMVGAAAFTAFCAIVPALLAWTEHKEQLVTLQMPAKQDISDRGTL